MTIVISGLYGLLFGSFLTVVVDRVPRGASVVRPGSACGACGTRLTATDLVPLLSWVALRGRCRTCGARIGLESVLIELVTGGLFALFAWHFGWSWELPAYCVLATGLVGLTAIDLRTKRLPREITYTTAAVGVPLLVVAALVAGEPERIWRLLLGAGISFGLMALIYVASRGGMGDGDVRLSPLLGAYLGYLNPGIAAVGLFFGFAAGALVGVALMAVRRGGRKTEVPFGPFLALGTMIAIFQGQAYIDLIMVR